MYIQRIQIQKNRLFYKIKIQSKLEMAVDKLVDESECIRRKEIDRARQFKTFTKL